MGNPRLFSRMLMKVFSHTSLCDVRQSLFPERLNLFNVNNFALTFDPEPCFHVSDVQVIAILHLNQLVYEL